MPVAHIILQNEHRAYAALLRSNYWPQIRIIELAPMDLVWEICSHEIHLLNKLRLNTTKIGTAPALD